MIGWPACANLGHAGLCNLAQRRIKDGKLDRR
jgi:hypothetical protein